MSKAFTREDEDSGFQKPAPSVRHSQRRLTAFGARLVRERLADLERDPAHVDSPLAVDRMRELLEGAEILAPAGAEHVALGARVRVRSEKGTERELVIVTPDEVGVVPDAISAASPLAHALIGALVGDTVELELPGGIEELTVVSLVWPH